MNDGDMMRQCDALTCGCSARDILQGKLPAHDSSYPVSRLTTMTKLRVLGLGLVLSGGFSAVEWTAGRWSHSLTLVTDAGHMLSDSLALGLALGATCIAHVATTQKSWLGTHKAESLAALANGVGLIILALWVMWEATERFQHSHPAIASEIMLVTAIIGLGVNLMAASALHDHSYHDLNVRGAFLHVLADTASSAGVLVSAVLIWAFHWNWADQLISMFIAALIAMGAFPLIHASIKTLLASRPSQNMQPSTLTRK